MTEHEAETQWAKLMFEAYNHEGPNPGKTWDGRDVPPWDKCGDQVQAKWRAAARKARALGRTESASGNL